jgi:hypothetical protein
MDWVGRVTLIENAPDARQSELLVGGRANRCARPQNPNLDGITCPTGARPRADQGGSRACANTRNSRTGGTDRSSFSRLSRKGDRKGDFTVSLRI